MCPENGSSNRETPTNAIMNYQPAASWQLGAFAFESDLIDSHQLVAAVEVWSRDPVRDLTDILMEQRSLDVTDLRLLHALWQQSQAAADGKMTNPLTRDDTLGASSVPNESDVELFGITSEGDRRRTTGHEIPQYRVERELATGGLGSVAVARDLRINRLVALKRIKDDLRHHPAGQARFLREAEITGALEHPSIVPLYESGVAPDGVPWYAMRLLGDETLRDKAMAFHATTRVAKDYYGLEFRRLLAAFISACQGISFAHSRSVIHRDIKPANIVMGEHGEAVVIDWGLAKWRNEEHELVRLSHPWFREMELSSNWVEDNLTVEGSAIGTPGFLSPEQANGHLMQIDVSSDVFGLGATLYFLLVGKAPYDGHDSAEILEKARNCDFIAPRRIQPGVPAALEAVCLKAMKANQQDRYGDVDKMRSDLECWLADEPVSVMAEPLGQRWIRFARRNRSLVGLGIAALVVIAITATIFSVLLAKQVEVAELATGNAVLLAEERGRLADSEQAARTEAVKQRRLALRTLHALVFDVRQKLAPIEASHSVRASILETSLKGLREIGVSVREQPLVDRDALVANQELGRIFLLFGGPDGSESTSLAIKHIELACEIAERLAAVAGVNDIEAHRDLSIAWESLGDACIELGQLDRAGAAYNTSLQITKDVASRHPGDPSVLRDLGFGWEKVGDYHQKRGDKTGAELAFAECLDAFAAQFRLDPANPNAQRDYSVALSKQGNMLVEAGDLAGAESVYRNTLELVRNGLAAETSVFQPRDESVLLNKLGTTLLKLQRQDDARTCFVSSLAVARNIQRAAQDSRQARRDLSVALRNVADINLLAGDHELAREHFEECLQICEKLIASDPSSYTAQTDLAFVLERMGKLETTVGNLELGRKHYGRALATLDALAPETVAAFAELRELREKLESGLED